MKKIILLITLIFSVINVFGQRHYYVYPSRHHYANVRHRIPVIVEERVIVVEKQPIIIKQEPNIVYERNCNQDYPITDNSNYDGDDVNIIDNFNNDCWDITILFKEDSYKLKDDHQLVLLQNVAEYMQKNPHCTITIHGYASKCHGTYDYNKILSKRRCIGAKQYLEQYYHIDCSRIEMFVHGTDNPRYSIDKWNRCLVIKCNNK